ncbi:hypothetical protein EC845_0531 [Comamonas sp. BIGb0124]|jgi:hypothetical protein|uniref:hypothetical protein n=1 Tax=Comamonas sp. BIGb0124 TaxID=2485130 RepID=UPI000F46273D|nr:hypothetical protein [Comamonas sp. BIGb0124]ROR24506.1 hypothetical protein EC845_0531 [Comamonas sp. BIGb0124]
MREIRLAWSTEVQERLHMAWPHTLWFPDTPTTRAGLERARDTGLSAFGLGTHWIEEREA